MGGSELSGGPMLYERLLTRRHPIYATPEDFLAAVVEYFQWSDANPLKEETVGFFQGTVCRGDASKLRAFSKQALATYLGMPVSRLDSYKARKEPAWREVIELIEQVIYEQKFSAAAAGLLNSNIMTRDLGLSEKKEITGADGGPMQVIQYQLPSNGRDEVPAAVALEEIIEDEDERPA